VGSHHHRILSLGHPPTDDDRRPLDPARRLAALATLVVFVLTFVPEPSSSSMSERPSWHQYFLTISARWGALHLHARQGGRGDRARQEHPGDGLQRLACRAAALHGSGLSHLHLAHAPGETEENCFRTSSEINAIAQAAKNGASIRDAESTSRTPPAFTA